jgi:hypothetical protein
MTIAPTDAVETSRREDARWRAVSAEHGIASLRHTHWLDSEPRAYDGAPGTWAAGDGRVVGAGIEEGRSDAATDRVALAPGEHLDVGRLRLRAIDRDGALALRVFDPETPGRTRLRGIHSFPPNAEWVLPGVFRAAEPDEVRVVRSVDGYEREEPAVGTIALEVAGQSVELTVSGSPAGFSAVIADASSGVDSYRFRFLPIAAPADGGSVTVDFNRAYLPPCAFSDQYVCPLPPEGNRLAVRVEAGERAPDRD